VVFLKVQRVCQWSERFGSPTQRPLRLRPPPNHSDYSLLDGGQASCADWSSVGFGAGYGGVALTVTVVMYGATRAAFEALHQGGHQAALSSHEMYVNNGSIVIRSREEPACYHLGGAGKNATAIRQSCQAHSLRPPARHARPGHLFARHASKAVLRQYSEGLIVATACLGREIPRRFSRGRRDRAAMWPASIRSSSATTSTWKISDHGSREGPDRSTAEDRAHRLRAGHSE